MSERDDVCRRDQITSLPFKGPQLGTYEKGRRAAADGKLRGECPYVSTRGQFRKAWLAGYDAYQAGAK